MCEFFFAVSKVGYVVRDVRRGRVHWGGEGVVVRVSKGVTGTRNYT